MTLHTRPLFAVLLVLAGTSAGLAEDGKYVKAAKAKFEQAEERRAEALALMKKHPTREDLPGKPFYRAMLDLNAAETALERAKKKGESISALDGKAAELREAYAAEYFEFISPLILSLAKKGKERYVWSAMGTIRQIEKYITAKGPSESLTAQAKAILAKGGEAEVRKYLDEAERRLGRGDFPKAEWNAKTAERLAKAPALKAEAAALRKTIEQKRGAAIEQKQLAKQQRAQGIALMEQGRFADAEAFFQRDPKSYAKELKECSALAEAEGIADVADACRAIRASWRQALIWKPAYWVNRFQWAPAYGLKRIEPGLKADPSNAALLFQKALFHFAHENYPTVQELIAKIVALHPGFSCEAGVSIGTYKQAIEAVMTNASAQSDYRTKRSAIERERAGRQARLERVDALYAVPFKAWKGGVETFLRAF